MSLSLRNLAVAAVIVISGSMVAENASAGGCHIGGYGGGYSQGSYGYSQNNYRTQNTNYRSSNHAVAQPQFGFTHVPCSHGLRLNYVAYGSVAYRLGLQCDDVIISLNHRLVRTGHDWHRELAFAMRNGGLIELEVRKCSGPVEIMIVRFGAIGGGGQTPVSGAGGPVIGGQTPVIGAEPQTDVVDAPVEQVEPAAPVEQIQAAAPPEELPPTAPAEEIDEPAAPAEQIQPVAPVEQVEPAAPAEELPITAPAEKIEPAAPAEKIEPAAPAEKIEPAAPAEEVKPAHVH